MKHCATDFLRIGLSVVFVISSLLKAVNILSFGQEVELYIDTYLWSGLNGWGVYLAMVVCWIEMAGGMLGFKRQYEGLAGIVFFILLTFFVYLTGENWLFPSVVGSVESCGCFGEWIHFTPMHAFFKSILLWTICSIWLYFLWKKKGTVKHFKDLQWDSYLVKAIMLSLLPSVYSILCMGRLQPAVYLVLYVLLCLAILGLVFMNKKNLLRITYKFKNQ